MRRRKKKRQDDELSRLEREVRELKSVNRSLLKQLKKLGRGRYRHLPENQGKKPQKDYADDKDDSQARECPICHEGNIIERLVLDRHWQECSKCDRRTKVKII